MASVPNNKSIKDLVADEEMAESGNLETQEYYMTADFDQNLTLL